MPDKLKTYFDFLKRMKKLAYGEKLKEYLRKKEVYLIIILPRCSEKNREKMYRIAFDTAIVDGDENIASYLDKDVNYVGILNSDLAEAVQACLNERRKEDGQKEEREQN